MASDSKRVGDNGTDGGEVVSTIEKVRHITFYHVEMRGEATLPLQPGEFRPSSSPAPAVSPAPLPSSCPCADHCVIAPQSRHRVPVAPPRRPVAPLRSHRTLRLLDAAGLRTTGTAELPPPLAASRRLAPLRNSAAPRYAPTFAHTAHLRRRSPLRNISGDATAPPLLAAASDNIEAPCSATDRGLIPLLLSRCSFPNPETLLP
ncbi:hypothetical protein U1Q18_023024 [Sarracenia purpurea var. burkii]